MRVYFEIKETDRITGNEAKGANWYMLAVSLVVAALALGQNI
jgi:hypothetical protein